jgi:hypothetical protein
MVQQVDRLLIMMVVRIKPVAQITLYLTIEVNRLTHAGPYLLSRMPAYKNSS